MINPVFVLFYTDIYIYIYILYMCFQGGAFKVFGFFSSLLDRVSDPIRRMFFSIGLKPPTTPRKFNTAPENRWLEDYFPIGMVTFQGLS